MPCMRQESDIHLPVTTKGKSLKVSPKVHLLEMAGSMIMVSAPDVCAHSVLVHELFGGHLRHNA